MTYIRRCSALFCFVMCSQSALAADFSLTNIDDTAMRSLVGDISANFLHTTVSGASSLGSIFGFEFGVIGGQTKTPHIDDIVKATDPTASADKLANVNLIGILTVPFGITAEIGLLPSVGKEDFKVSSTSLAVKWTPTDTLLDWPLSVAVKGSYTQSKLSFKQDIASVPISYGYENKETAVMALVSKNFVIVEPYFGLGVVNAKGELSANSSSVFASGGTSQEAKRSGTAWMVGTELKLLVVKLGVEYTKVFDTSRVTGKLSFYF